MRKAERTTLIKFLLLYGGSLIFFLIIIGTSYYQFHTSQIQRQQQNELRLVAFNALKMLRSGMNPPKGVEWSLVGDDGTIIMGDYNLPHFSPCSKENEFEQFIVENGYLYLIRKVPKHTGATHISVRVPLNTQEVDRIRRNIILIWGGAFLFFMTIAAFLSYLFLKPLRNTIELLDRFIKDATHELTTPISAILMSIESMDKESLNERNKKRLDRIIVAARTLQVVYDDLAYLMIGSKDPREKIELDLIGLIHQRVNYLRPAAKVRNITWRLDLENYKPPFVVAREFARILDNLISNAIKYNRSSGEIYIKLTDNQLSIQDEGSGIASEQKDRIYERFTRLEESQGGFGLGLAIVRELCIKNGLAISFAPAPTRGTIFTISW